MENEYIGKVKLDLSLYQGKDLYCDGSVEDELLETVRELPEDKYREVIEEKAKWPVLYHLSPERGNIVSWLPLKGKKILEVGSGCGAVTGALAAAASEVTCVELSKKRSLINAYRHKELDNICIHVGNFQDIEHTLDSDYDYIMLIGVLEYADLYIGGENAQEQFLKCLRRHLGENGRLVVAIENRYGLKYFAGCAEDHTGRYFDGIENYPRRRGVRTFGIEGLRKSAVNSGFTEIHEYYPYPDYKFMNTLFSSKRTPVRGELKNNICNYDRERMLIFDETKAFDGITEDGSFRTFSNSYLLILGSDVDVSYVKYSSDRDKKYAIATCIVEEDGKRVVKKRALYGEGAEHIRSLEENRRILCRQFSGSGLAVNELSICEEDGMPVACFEYLEGETLEEKMMKVMSRGDTDAACDLFDRYLEHIKISDESEKSCRDLIFSNFIIKGDKWTLIDYEWMDEQAASAGDYALRALYCYGLEHPGDKLMQLARIKKRLGDDITEKLRLVSEDEMHFQKKVTGGRLALGEIRSRIGNPVREMNVRVASDPFTALQIYEDCGRGFSEENSYMDLQTDLYNSDGFKSRIALKDGIKSLRLDPGMRPCIVRVLSIKLESGGKLKEIGGKISTNGRKLSRDCYVFADNDPNITVKTANAAAGDHLEVCLCVSPISATTARAMI